LWPFHSATANVEAGPALDLPRLSEDGRAVFFLASTRPGVVSKEFGEEELEGDLSSSSLSIRHASLLVSGSFHSAAAAVDPMELVVSVVLDPLVVMPSVTANVAVDDG
jgi:hypothetical protein